MKNPLQASLAAPGPARLWALEDLTREPAGDPEIAAAIAPLLEDRSPCRIDAFYIAETRLLAALALATQCARPVHVRSVQPVRVGDLIALLESAGIPWPQADDKSGDAAFVAFEIAKAHGLLFERDFELVQPLDVGTLALKLPQGSGADEPAPHAPPAAPPPMPTEDDLQSYLGWLAHGTVDDRVFTLQELIRRPTGDARVTQALEPLLNDNTPCVLQIPYRFGEIRYLASRALAGERSTVGDDRPVMVGCTAPLTADELERVGRAARISAPQSGNPIENQLGLFARLREYGLLPQIELKIMPCESRHARPVE